MMKNKTGITAIAFCILFIRSNICILYIYAYDALCVQITIIFCGPTQYSILLNGIKCECFYYYFCFVFCFLSFISFGFVFVPWIEHVCNGKIPKWWRQRDNNINKRTLTIPTALCGGQSTIPNPMQKKKMRLKSGRDGEWGVNGIVQKSLNNQKNSYWKLIHKSKLWSPFVHSSFQNIQCNWRLNGIPLPIAPIFINFFPQLCLGFEIYKFRVINNKIKVSKFGNS